MHLTWGVKERSWRSDGLSIQQTSTYTRKSISPNCPMASKSVVCNCLGIWSVWTWLDYHLSCTDGLPTMEKESKADRGQLGKTSSNVTWLPYDRVDSGRGRSSCERPQDLGAFSTSGSRCIDTRCYLMMMMIIGAWAAIRTNMVVNLHFVS